MTKKFVQEIYQAVFSYGLLLLMLISPVYADSDTEQQIKAGFVLNFAKFVTWPNLADNATTPLVICVSASTDFFARMALLQNKKIDNRAIEVFSLSDKQMQSCHLIFLSETQDKQNQKKLLDSIATLPILTVSDIPDFIQENGMIGMKKSNNRLRFDINLINVKRAGLTISSQLLDLANEVIQ